MSKSDENVNAFVAVLDDPDTILRKFKRAVTDSDACVRFDPANKPGVSNLMQIYAVATGKSFASIEQEFAGHGYGDFKQAVGESVVELLRPIREETLTMSPLPWRIMTGTTLLIHRKGIFRLVLMI